VRGHNQPAINSPDGRAAERRRQRAFDDEQQRLRAERRLSVLPLHTHVEVEITDDLIAYLEAAVVRAEGSTAGAMNPEPLRKLLRSIKHEVDSELYGHDTKEEAW